MMMSGWSKPQLTFAGVMNNNSKGHDYSQNCLNWELISGIRIHWNRTIITSFELAYNWTPVGAVSGFGHNNQAQEDIFSVDKWDAIVEVYGRFDKVIYCIGITTLSGKTRTWWSPIHGEEFSFSAQGSYIKALKIRAGEFVEYLEPVYGNLMFLGARQWNVNTSVKISEHFRDSGSGDEEFTDFEWVKDKFNFTVNKVSVWFNQRYISGIQVHYGVDGTVKSPGMHMGDNDMENKKVVLEIAEGEFIKSVFVKSENFLTYIHILTTKGNTLSVGQNVGDGYLFNVPGGHQITAFSGELSQNLRRLRLHYDEIY